MKEIPLSKGKVAIVDDDDYKSLSKYKWWMSGAYAIRVSTVIGQRRRIWMHRLVAGTPDGLFADHINGNPLDNRRCNLRNVTKPENALNRSPRYNKTYKGITERRGKWRVVIAFQGKQYRLGHYDTQEEAQAVYDLKAVELHGEFARLNFPERRTEYEEKLTQLGGTFIVKFDPMVYGAVNRNKTHCSNGHEYTLDNTRNNRDGSRHCRICAKATQVKKHKPANEIGGRLVKPSGQVNALKTHCPHGHEYTVENTYLRNGGVGRQCRSCRRAKGVIAARVQKEERHQIKLKNK